MFLLLHPLSLAAGSIVIAIAATKCDLLNESKPTVPISEAEALAQALGAIFVDTSAKDNYGIANLFQKVAERVLRFRENGTELPVTPGASVNNKGMINGTHELADDGFMTKRQTDIHDRKQNNIQHSDHQSNLEDDSDDYRIKGKEAVSTNGSKDSSKSGKEKNKSFDAQSSTSKLMMCDSSPLACGMFGDDNMEEGRSQSCRIS